MFQDVRNNNLRLIMVKTDRSTLHTVGLYDIQQSATQGSNDTTHRLSHRTAATTRFSPEGLGCQKQTAPRFLPTSNQVGLYLASIHQRAPPEHTSINRPATHVTARTPNNIKRKDGIRGTGRKRLVNVRWKRQLCHSQNLIGFSLLSVP